MDGHDSVTPGDNLPYVALRYDAETDDYVEYTPLGSTETEMAIGAALDGRVSARIVEAAKRGALVEGYRMGAERGGRTFEGDPKPEYRKGWQRQPFAALAAVPVEPPSIIGMLYPRQRHIVSSEPGFGKTWLGLYAAAEVMKAGGAVVWVNTDDAPEAELLERLTALSVTEAQIEALWHYYRPDKAAGTREEEIFNWNTEPPTLIGQTHADIVNIAIEVKPVLAVLDSFNPTLALQGLDYMDETDVEQAWQTFARPFTDVGAALLALDHLTKATDNRGRYSIGSQRKLAGSSVHIGMRPVTGAPFGRGVTGRAALTIHKDRSGYLGAQGTTLGNFVLNNETGHMTTAYIEPPTSENAEGAFRPTELMKRVSRTLEEAPNGLTGNAVVRETEGRRGDLLAALMALVADSYVRREAKGAGFVYYSETPYTGSLIPLEADTESDDVR